MSRATALLSVLLVLAAAPAIAQAAPAASGAAQPVCSAPAPGQMACLAEVLKRHGHIVHPVVHHAPVAVHRALDAHAEPAGASAPAPGSPQFFQQAYDLTALSATHGVGDTIAIVDAYDDPALQSDLAVFRSTYGLAPCTEANGCLDIVNENGSTSPLPAANGSWSTEETLDVEAVSSLCPNCHILVVEASSTSWNDLMTGDVTAAKMGAQQISDSWGSDIPSGQDPSWPASLSGASAPEVVASSGDSGVVPAGETVVPAAMPAVTAAGGTSISQDAGSAADGRGYSESAWSGAGSGCDTGSSQPTWQPAGVCVGRAFSDVSAVADPSTGLNIYEASIGGWALGGGTSLSAPMIAAFEAVTGINAHSPSWAYASETELNPTNGGSNGSCTNLQPVICAALGGYSGPTGAGTISGEVVPGAPGIGGPSISNGNGGSTYTAAVSSSTATLSGGVYANGLATTYSWEYGTTTGYGSQSTPAPLPAGTGPVLISTQLTGLQPSTTYHYRLIATNADGTSYGYDYTFTTPAAPASVTSTPTDGGTTSTSTTSIPTIPVVSTGSTSSSSAASRHTTTSTGSRFSSAAGQAPAARAHHAQNRDKARRANRRAGVRRVHRSKTRRHHRR